MEDPGMTARGIAGSRVRGVFVEDQGRAVREIVILSKGGAHGRPRAGDLAGCWGIEYTGVLVIGREREIPRDGGISSGCVFV